MEPVWNQDQNSQLQQSHNVFVKLYGEIKGRELSTKTLVQLQSKKISQAKNEPTEFACIHFLNGYCRFEDRCMNVHDYDAPRPPCRFQQRPGGCTNDNCVYAHEEQNNDSDGENGMVDQTHGRYSGGAYAWLRQNSQSVLVLGNCGFGRSLQAMGASPGIILSGSVVKLSNFHNNGNLLGHFANGNITRCVWNFPITNDADNESLIRGFFMSASIYFKPKLRIRSHLEVGIALRGNEFTKWDVLASAQQSGFCFEWYEDFDPAIFPNYTPDSVDNIEMPDAKFYVFRMKKNVLKHKPKMIQLRESTKIGVELEMSCPGYVGLDSIADELTDRSGVRVENMEHYDYAEGKKTTHHWKLIQDGSLACNLSQPDCNKFELVSPILRSEEGLARTSKILRQLSHVNVSLNRSMGFHVHLDVSNYSIAELIKICQQYVKYESAIDSMLPLSRRTGSRESNEFFRSNSDVAKDQFGKDEEGLLIALGSCKNYHDLAEIMNPYNSRYYKLNLQNLTSGRQNTFEFRQHSSTADYEKVDAWVRFCVRFCENSIGSEKPTQFARRSQSVDELFDDLFQNIIRDSVLHSFYKDRRHLLSVDDEGDGCCHGCVAGRGCSK